MKILTLLSFLSCTLYAGTNSVGGSILSAGGLAVPGATVYLRTQKSTQVTVSDLQGNYAFRSVDDGDYTLQAWTADRVSKLSAVNLRGDIDLKQNSVLSAQITRLPVTLKVSPVDSLGGDTNIFNLDIDPSCTQANDTLNDISIKTALESLKTGEYQIVVTKPGSVYVGTCMISRDVNASISSSNIIHTSGMEIVGEDFINAISDQVSLPQTSSCCL